MKLILPDPGLLTQTNTPRLRLSPETLPHQEEHLLLAEHLLEVFINDVPTYNLVCSPTMLPEMLLGRMLTEGVIHSMQEVNEISFRKDGFQARVYLNKRGAEQEQPTAELVPSSSTGSRILSTRFADQKVPPLLSPIPYEPEWIYRLSGVIDRDTPLYAATRSAHSCVLMREGEILLCAEDIGRHNAMDKVIGWALLHQIPLKECIIYTSGRIPVDMTIKAIRAGIPVLVSKALPTDKAVELARAFRLTLIGSAHPDGFQVFVGDDFPIRPNEDQHLPQYRIG